MNSSEFTAEPAIYRVERAKDIEKRWKSDLSVIQGVLDSQNAEAVREWGIEPPAIASGPGIDPAALRHDTATLHRVLGLSSMQTLKLELHPHVQVTGALPYDESWGTGAGWPLARHDGKPIVLGREGFSASGFGLYLTSPVDVLTSIMPRGRFRGSWVKIGPGPFLRSRAGAGVVVYDGNDIIVSRQPIVWDLVDPGAWTGETFDLPFANVASKSAAETLGTVPLAPVLFQMVAGRTYLLWFYVWHLGANFAPEVPFLAIIEAEIPIVTAVSGPVPIIK